MNHTRATAHLTHQKYRADIDGLRAIAVLSVIGYHAFPNIITGGFTGVDIFFVISGYLISTIILSSLERGSFSFLEFYIRRIRRIFPALLLILIACFAFGWHTLLADEYKQLGKHIAGGAGFISNLVLWNESGYFNNAAESKPLLHLWSLGIEEQYYIFWPFLLWLAWKNKLNILTILITTATISFTLNINEVSHNVVAAFYSPITRFWELIMGSVLAYAYLHKDRSYVNQRLWLDQFLNKIIYSQPPKSNGDTLRNTLSLLGITLIITSTMLITKNMRFPGWYAVIPALGTVLTIAAGPNTWLNRALLSKPILLWVGSISYPLYLWHWPLLSFARIIEGTTPSIESRVIAIASSVALAWLTYILIERPIRYGNKSIEKTTVLICLMLLIGTIGYIDYQLDGMRFRSLVKRTSVINDQLEGWKWKYTENTICKDANKYNFNIFCMQSSSISPTLILLGNSYANHLYAGLTYNNKTNHHSVLSFGSCDPTARNENDCMSQDEIIQKHPSIKFAIFSNSWPRFNEQGQQVNHFTGKIIPGGAIKSKYIEGLSSRIEYLESKGIKIIIFGPKPEIDYDVRYCFSRPLKSTPNTCSITLADTFSQEKGILEIFNAILMKHPNTSYFDQNQLFCNEHTCTVTKNGMPLLRDAGHYSEYGSQEIINLFTKWATTNSPGLLRTSPQQNNQL